MVHKILWAALCAAAITVSGCASKDAKPVAGTPTAENTAIAEEAVYVPTEEPGGSKVYFTGDISGNGIMAVYRALERPVEGRVALKVHMGEPGNTNYLNPELLRELALSVKGNFVDCNVYYGGPRVSITGHLQAAKDHGFTFVPVDILDAEGDIRIPVVGGSRITEAIVGRHIENYDWVISVAHFKGHSMAGFGGTFKNIGVGFASPAGKKQIHDEPGGRMFSTTGNAFLEKVIETAKAVVDFKEDRFLYINVLNNLSVDCDCAANAAHPTMADIGILASTDPVALEKASLDLIYARPEAERRHLVQRIESRNGGYQIIYAEQIGLGSQEYELIKL
ncbi:hypothetical protein FACS189493_2250 [Spirochaetia bacterium]|nr:hypothetical protein FACS189493_2250 [Spirochaetia bacterium]